MTALTVHDWIMRASIPMGRLNSALSEAFASASTTDRKSLAEDLWVVARAAQEVAEAYTVAAAIADGGGALQ